jgi:hypothetical protein
MRELMMLVAVLLGMLIYWLDLLGVFCPFCIFPNLIEMGLPAFLSFLLTIIFVSVTVALIWRIVFRGGKRK